MPIKNIQVRLELDEYDRLDAYRKRRRTSFQAVIVEALSRLMDEPLEEVEVEPPLAERRFIEKAQAFYRLAPVAMIQGVRMMLEAAAAGLMTDRERQRTFGHWGPRFEEDEGARAVERQEQTGAKQPSERRKKDAG